MVGNYVKCHKIGPLPFDVSARMLGLLIKNAMGTTQNPFENLQVNVVSGK